MKISEAAARYGVSAQAIYQRLQKSGKPLETLKAKGSKDLTAEGVAYLEAYFNKKRQDDDKQNSSVYLIRELQDKLKDAETQIKILQSQLESAEKDAKRAEEAKQKAEETLDFERRLLGRLLPSSGQVETDNRADAAAPVEVVASVDEAAPIKADGQAETHQAEEDAPAKEAAPAEEKHRWVPWWRRG